MNTRISSFSCDVDGVLNDYPLCWLRFLAEKCGTLYETVELAKKREDNYRIYKDEYRNSSYKANLPILRKNRDVINCLTSKGLNNIIVTSRPIKESKYPFLYERTFQWLNKNEVNFKYFDFKDPDANYLDRYPNILFHIDDDPQYALIVAAKNVKVYLLKNDNWDFSSVPTDNIQIINDLNEILEYESIL